MMSSERTVEQWAAEVARLERQIAELQQRVQWYEEQFRLAKHRQFGAPKNGLMPTNCTFLTKRKRWRDRRWMLLKKPSRIRARKDGGTARISLSSSARRAHYLRSSRG
ncbi:hypothetical protein [Sulfobacillus thermosulfidooxidans]|uniref:hypothetical protein n=1 Tax=Sulfobacillus thermosulfidooxidans TaxID=28034 RepID=UPI00241858C7|nr:hypothetical protein [Sulfobacillus thermosulfidooxidans]